MNRFKCPACGGNQYTACDTAEGCIYCGNNEVIIWSFARLATENMTIERAIFVNTDTISQRKIPI